MGQDDDVAWRIAHRATTEPHVRDRSPLDEIGRSSQRRSSGALPTVAEMEPGDTPQLRVDYYLLATLKRLKSEPRLPGFGLPRSSLRPKRRLSRSMSRRSGSVTGTTKWSAPSECRSRQKPWNWAVSST